MNSLLIPYRVKIPSSMTAASTAFSRGPLGARSPRSTSKPRPCIRPTRDRYGNHCIGASGAVPNWQALIFLRNLPASCSPSLRKRTQVTRTVAWTTMYHAIRRAFRPVDQVRSLQTEDPLHNRTTPCSTPRP